MENKVGISDNYYNLSEEEYKEMQRLYDLLPMGKVIPFTHNTPKQNSSQASSFAPTHDTSDSSTQILDLSTNKKTNK